MCRILCVDCRRCRYELGGDAWAGSTKSYFYAHYYPEGGSGVNLFSGYSYSTTTWDGKLWWDEGSGGEGLIYSSINGDQASPWAVGNSQRVISTVVILGYRYSGYSLADMRIHDINVVCDLNEHDPNAPSVPPPTQGPPPGGTPDTIECDGTELPPSQTADTTISTFETDAPNFLSCYWTGWWPVLHFVVSFNPYPTAEISIDIWADIIGMWGVDSFSFQLVDESSMSDSEINALAANGAQAYAPFFGDIRALTIYLNVAYWAARTLAPLAEKGNLVAQWLFAIAVAAFVVIWHMWLLEFINMVIRSAMDPIAAAYTLVALAVSVLLVVGSTYAASGRLPSAIYSAFGITDIIPETFSLASYAIFAMSLMMIIQIVALAACMIFTPFLEDVAADMGYVVCT